MGGFRCFASGLLARNSQVFAAPTIRLYFPGTCSTWNLQLHPSAFHWTSPQESQCIAVIAGASANNYLLASKSTEGVQSGTGKLNLASDMAAGKTGDGGLATTFTLKLPAGAEAPTASTDCM